MFFNFKKNQVWAESSQIIMQVGLTMAGCIVFCFFIGRFLDNWLGTKGIFVTIFTLLGVVGGGNVVYRQIIAMTEKKDKENGPADGSD